MTLRGVIALLALTLSGGAFPHAQEDGIRLLLARMERILQAGDGPGFMGTLADSADRNRARDFMGGE